MNTPAPSSSPQAAPVTHYENFPVASWLCPAPLRQPIAAIYAFARAADDLADEGTATPAQRLQQLQAYRSELHATAGGQPPAPHWAHIFAPLQHQLQQRQLPVGLLDDLLSAFIQDIEKTRDGATYADREALLDYCRRSANPVGRLLLHLYGVHDAQALAHSDAICTALQLINFWQDVAVDWSKGRVYIPQDDLARFRIGEAQIAARDVSGVWPMLMDKEVKRALAMLEAGSPLGLKLKGRLGLELRLIILGGERILKKIHDARGDVLTQRPVLVWKDWLYMVWKALTVPYATKRRRA